MFYLETKDGEKFLTDVKSDDKVEFAKILEQKLGKDAADIFNQILDEIRSEGQVALTHDIDYVIDQLRDIRNELSQGCN